MKKSILTLFVLFICAIQTTTAYEYFTIYFSDGTKSEAFYATDVDSICYSKLSLDGIAYDDWQVQEIYTIDSVYRFPLTHIDSLSFMNVDEDVIADRIVNIGCLVYPLYSECNNSEELSRNLSALGELEDVENIWIDDNTLFVKIREWGTLLFNYPVMRDRRDSTVINTNKSVLRSVRRNNSEHILNGARNICIANQLAHADQFRWDTEDKILLASECKQYGLDINYVSVPMPNFFYEDIFNYDLIFLDTHGSFDSKNKKHWILTGEKLCEIDTHNDFVEDFRLKVKNFLASTALKYKHPSPNNISLSMVEEIHDGEKLLVFYTTISENFILSSPYRFKEPGKSIIFNAACQSLKGNDNLAFAFLHKGAGCYLGYTETNHVGGEAGFNFFRHLLNGKCTSSALRSLDNRLSDEQWYEYIYWDEEEQKVKIIETSTYDSTFVGIASSYRSLLRMVPEDASLCISKPETFPLDVDVSTGRNENEILRGRIKILNTTGFADNYVFGFKLVDKLDLKEVKETYTVDGTYDQSTLYMNWEKRLDTSNFQPNTTYYYRAYMNDGYSDCYGDIMLFTVEDKRKPYGVITGNGTHLTFYYDENKNKHMEETVIVSPGNPTITYNCHDIREVTFDASFHNYEPTSTKLWFSNMDNLTTITNLQYLNTTKVTEMDWMFGGCSSLASVDLDSLNTTNVTSMYEMFVNCKSLTNIDLSNFNTSNVTTMWGMFRNCTSLSSLDISKFNTENVINISYMFADCSSLKSINVSGLNTNNLLDMGHVFEGCSSLTYIDLSSFNTTKVTGMPYLFNGCHSLTTIDLSSFNTDNVTNMSYMFSGCSSLETIYAGNWKPTSGYDNGSMMFLGCEKLTGGNGTKIGNNLYDYDNYGNPLYYYCPDNRSAAHIDGGKDNPGLFTAK